MKETAFLESTDAVAVNLARHLAFFVHLPSAHIETIQRMSRMRHYAPGETIIPEGAYDSFIYVLLTGTVEILKGGIRIAGLHTPGELFGELAVLTCDCRSASVVAMSKTTCLAVDASFLDSLPPENKDAVSSVVYKMMAEVVSNRLRLTSQELSTAHAEIGRLRAELAQAR